MIDRNGTKKHLMWLLLPLIIFSCSRVDENEFGTSLASFNLKGNVVSVKHSIHNASVKFGELTPGALCKKAYAHPLSFGYSYEINEEYFHGAICKRTFNDEGMLLTEKWYNEEKKVSYEKINKYANNQLVESISEHVYKFIPNTIYKEVFSYDQTTGKLKEIATCIDTLQPISQVFEYSKNTETVRSGKSYFTTSYESERPAMRVYYDSTGAERRIIKYNKNGFVISCNGDESEEYKYNEYNDPVLKSEDIDSYTFEYEYDKKKNWTKRITYKDDVPMYVEVREITYSD